MKPTLAWLLLALTSIDCLAQRSAQESQLVVQDIECRGNTLTPCDLIRDRLYLSAGSPVDEEEISNAKLRLSSLPNFTAVDIYLEKGAEKGRVLVIVEVAEADPWTKESVFATAARGSTSYERIAGRISNENLWGTGKVASLEAGGVLPISGFTGGSYYSRLQYADPRLFDSKKYFLIGGAHYEKVANDFDSGSSVNQESLGVDLTIGRRIFDFSYVTVGYLDFPISTRNNRIVESDGSVTIQTASAAGQWLVTYGWNTEDDPFFPTRGSRLQVFCRWELHGDSRHCDGGYRQTWTRGISTWTLILGTAPGIVYRRSLDRNFDIGFEYGQDIGTRSDGEIQQGRWYIQPGQFDAGTSSSGDRLWEVGVKAGVRLETKTVGIVDLYFFGTKNVNVGGGQ